MKIILIISFILSNTSMIFAEEFNQKILTRNIIAECDAQKGDERGPFGITYKQRDIQHDFLVMTGVYYDTCKDLEKKINKLKRLYTHLILRGSGKTIFTPKNYVWRWQSIQTTTGNKCISYFQHDCEIGSTY